jgi:predicted TIM-barrel fold metal-dependent hydrolase
MRITDAQVHVWAESTPERPWPPEGVPPQRVPALEPGELLAHMDRAGVARAVLIPPTWEGSRNDLVLAAAAAHPDRFAVMGRLDWTDPSKVAEVPAWRSTPGMLGIRMSMNRGDVERLVRAGFDTGFFAAAQQHQVPITVYMPGRHGDLRRIAEAFPDLRITVDHLAIESADIRLDVAIKPLLPLAALPNVAVKASAMPCFVTEQFPFPSITGAVHQLVDAFGAERVFWGSDLSRLPCSYEQLIETFTQHMPRLTADQIRLVMGDAIAAWLGWAD